MWDEPRPRLRVVEKAARALRAGDLTPAGWAQLGLRVTRAEAISLRLGGEMVSALAVARVIVADDHDFGGGDFQLLPVRVVLALSNGALTPAGLETLGGRLPLEMADELPDMDMRRELQDRGLLGAPAAGISDAGRSEKPETVMGVGPTRTLPGRLEAMRTEDARVEPRGTLDVNPPDQAPNSRPLGLQVPRNSGVLVSEPELRPIDEGELPLIETAGFERQHRGNEGDDGQN